MLRMLARAKINWSLDILGRREDGYHFMDMLIQTVELGDECTFEPAQALSLRIDGEATLSATDNLILKAARALQTAAGCQTGAAITLHKRTPIGAGMGGGSADAAATLIGLNQLWQTDQSKKNLLAIAATIGADVPFLLDGGLARVTGIGEVIAPLHPAPQIPLVVVQPCTALSTKEVFQAFDTLPSISHPDTDKAQATLMRKDIVMLSRYSTNVLQQASESKRPQISEAIAALQACGASHAMMTGSGSAVFGAFADTASAQTAYSTLCSRWRKCWLTQTATEGVAIF